MGKKLSRKRLASHYDDVAHNEVSTIVSRPPVTCIDVVNEYILTASPENGVVRVINKETLKEENAFELHEKEITKIVTSGDSVFTASRDKSLCKTNISDTANRSIYKSHTLVVTALTLNKDATQLVSGSRDCSVKLWDVATCKEIRSETTPRSLVNDLKWSHDHHLIIKCSEDKVLKLIDEKSLKVIHSFPMKQYFQTCCDVDGDILTTGTTGANNHGCEIDVYDLRTNELLKTMQGHTQKISSCKFVPSIRHKLISVSHDSSMILWDVNEGAKIESKYIDGGRQLTDVCIDGTTAYVGTFQRGCCVVELTDETMSLISDF